MELQKGIGLIFLSLNVFIIFQLRIITKPNVELKPKTMVLRVCFMTYW